MTKEGDAALYSRLHPIKNPGIQRLLPSRIVFLFYVHFIVRRLKKNANTYFPPSSHCPPHGYHDRHFHFVDLHAHPTQRFFNPQINPVNAVGRATGMMIMILSCHATLALPCQSHRGEIHIPSSRFRFPPPAGYSWQTQYQIVEHNFGSQFHPFTCLDNFRYTRN